MVKFSNEIVYYTNVVVLTYIYITDVYTGKNLNLNDTK